MTFDKERLADNAKPLPMCQCVVCGYSFDCATKADLPREQRPRPGDFSLCMKCGEIYVFNPDMTVRIPTIDDMLTLDNAESKTLIKTQTKIRKERPLG